MYFPIVYIYIICSLYNIITGDEVIGESLPATPKNIKYYRPSIFYFILKLLYSTPDNF